MRRDQTAKDILAAIAQREKEIERLTIEINALRSVSVGGSLQSATVSTKAPRSNVKTAVLDLLKAVGANGLNAQIACDLAKEKGISLHIKSVSSLLSRLKHEGTVVYLNQLYILKELAPRAPAELSSEIGAIVRPASFVR